MPQQRPHVVIVGAGFGGLEAAKTLGRAPVAITLLDRQNYHCFQPLLYQVATAALSPAEVAWPIRHILRRQQNATVLMAEVNGIDATARLVKTAAGDFPFDFLVVATGARESYFGHDEWIAFAPGLKRIEDATRIRRSLLSAFEQAELARDEAQRRRFLTFVVVGGGPTGVEVAGALADMIELTVPAEYRNFDAGAARIHLLDYGDTLLRAFSDDAHGYVAKVLQERKVELNLGTGVKEVGPGHALLSDGTVIPTRCVVWGGGITGASVAADGGLTVGRGGRVDVQADLTLSGSPGVYVVGDVANIPGPGDDALPQLGSVAAQSGKWAAENILADFDGKERRDFAYKDKGIMAMIGRGAAIAEVGKHHHEVHGQLAHMAWLGVHASLMTGTRDKVEAIIDWSWDRFSKTGGPHVLDRGDAAEINWDDDPAVTAMGTPASAS